jgi:hypothetical protein
MSVTGQTHGIRQTQDSIFGGLGGLYGRQKDELGNVANRQMSADPKDVGVRTALLALNRNWITIR